MFSNKFYAFLYLISACSYFIIRYLKSKTCDRCHGIMLHFCMNIVFILMLSFHTFLLASVSAT